MRVDLRANLAGQEARGWPQMGADAVGVIG
jgi:hypothetical protein